MPWDPYVGEISIVGYNFAPRGWLSCDGQLLPITQYTSLFTILGTTYGGDGMNTFGLPDLRGKIPVHFDSTDFQNNYYLGASGGATTVNLSINQLPAHGHSVSNTGQVQAKTGAAANFSSPVGAYFANNPAETQRFTGSPDVAMGTITTIKTNNSGGNQAHENMQPFQAVNIIIAIEGIFPSRN